MSKQATNNKPNRRPRVLVLEGLSDGEYAVNSAGGQAIVASPRAIDRVDQLLKEGAFDALLLTGGGDVDPRLYGETPHQQVYGVSETRDLVEWMALERATELGVPVLGICRGSQIMAVHGGGRLRQHVPGHSGTSHLVWSEPSTLYRRVIGNAQVCVSLHHQCVKRTGPLFRVAARNKDGIIEAIESKDGRCLGVQFHPEIDYDSNDASRAIFRWLVLEAAKRAGLKRPRTRVMPKHSYGYQFGRATRPMKPRKQRRSSSSTLPKPVAKKPAKNRRAGQRTMPKLNPDQLQLPAGKRKHPVIVSWLCPTCGMRFDKSEDREDHITWFHTSLRVEDFDAEERDAMAGRIVDAYEARDERTYDEARERAYSDARSYKLQPDEPPVGHPDWEVGEAK